MINSERILRTLDENLDHSVELTVFGRAALALGFPDAPAAIERTLDVDGIIPLSQVRQLEEDIQFWIALEKTNRELASADLYLTHLFQEDQIALAPGWIDRRKPINRPVCERLIHTPASARIGSDCFEDDARW
jgi:hypothetical protein